MWNLVGTFSSLVVLHIMTFERCVFKSKLFTVSRNLIAFIVPCKNFKPYLPSLYLEEWKVVNN